MLSAQLLLAESLWGCSFNQTKCAFCDEQPVPRPEHNGEGFHYVVGYRLYQPLGERGPMSTSQVWDPTRSELIVYDVPIFQEYEIFVQSVNRQGKAPILGGERKIGYSGEGRKCWAVLKIIVNICLM